jgi:hypothetical protein
LLLIVVLFREHDAVSCSTNEGQKEKSKWRRRELGGKGKPLGSRSLSLSLSFSPFPAFSGISLVFLGIRFLNMD